MSKRSRATYAARRAAIRASGSHLTRRCRERICARLIRVLYRLGFQVQGLQSLRVEHIVKYIAERRKGKPDISRRTLQNEMSAIRVSLREAGREGLANHELISNAALGICDASHVGTNSSVSPAEYELVRAAASKLGPEFQAACELMRHMGLRALEVICCGASLRRWRRELVSGLPVHVVRGTKGGRGRWVRPSSPERALAAVELALEMLRHNRRPHLLRGNLKQAIGRLNRMWSRHCRMAAGRRVTPHSLRYTYAQDIQATYISEGYSDSDAKALVAMNLGHGDGRGRLVNSVYGQRPPSVAHTGAAEDTGNSRLKTFKHTVRAKLPAWHQSLYSQPIVANTPAGCSNWLWAHASTSFSPQSNLVAADWNARPLPGVPQ